MFKNPSFGLYDWQWMLLRFVCLCITVAMADCLYASPSCHVVIAVSAFLVCDKLATIATICILIGKGRDEGIR